MKKNLHKYVTQPMLASYPTRSLMSLLMEMNNPTSSSTDWVELFFQSLLNAQGPEQVSAPTDATAITTTVTQATAITTTVTQATAITTTVTQTIPTDTGLNPKRVAKPPIRRRASRSAPTTLINIDVTNFREMVQQFTGVPNPTSLTFGNIGSQSCQNVNANVISHGNGYGDIHRQQQHQQQQQQGYMFSLENRGNGSVSSFCNTRPNLQATDGFLRGNTPFQMFPRSSSSSHNRNGRLDEW